MDKDKLAGGARKMVGQAEETAGRILKDKQTTGQGLYDQAAGAAQSAYGQAKDAVNQGTEKVVKETSESLARAKDTVSDSADRLSSAVRDTVDSARQAAGPVADQVVGAARNVYGQARQATGVAADATSRQVAANPLSSVLSIGAICFVLGWILGGRN